MVFSKVCESLLEAKFLPHTLLRGCMGQASGLGTSPKSLRRRQGGMHESEGRAWYPPGPCTVSSGRKQQAQRVRAAGSSLSSIPHGPQAEHMTDQVTSNRADGGPGRGGGVSGRART